jgi:two-component system response regulator QseB
MRILLLEDHHELRQMISGYLSQRGYAVDGLERGHEALAAIKTTRYDALVLDLGLPDIDGIEVLSQIRRGTERGLPALILTARDGVEHRVLGLNAGADDYLTKPFDLAELEARLRAVLRRPGSRADTHLSLGNLHLDSSTRAVRVADVPLDLSRRETDCLEELLRAAGRVVVKDVLEDRLYSLDEPVTPNAVEAVISRLRRKLAQARAEACIATRRGIGYRLYLDET